MACDPSVALRARVRGRGNMILEPEWLRAWEVQNVDAMCDVGCLCNNIWLFMFSGKEIRCLNTSPKEPGASLCTLGDEIHSLCVLLVGYVNGICFARCIENAVSARRHEFVFWMSFWICIYLLQCIR